MNKVVIACDSFKGSLTSLEAGRAAAEGVHLADPDIETAVIPVADGGEGTVDALVSAMNGRIVTCRVLGPLGDEIEAAYGMSGDGLTAIIEMARASGLTLIPEERRNPLYTNTYGTGQLILDSLRHGCTTILVGIGGSATNDGGTGLLQALGARFHDAKGKELSPCGLSLEKIYSIDTKGLDPLCAEADFRIACDVDNPLYGPRGAARVFAPQKGADPVTVEQLDRGLRNYARAILKCTGRDVAEIPGAGAGGGLGACFYAFFNATLDRGISITLSAIDFDKQIRDADLIITGEGRLDAQTLMGKTPCGILRAAQKRGIPVVAVAGSVSDSDTAALLNAGFRAVLPIVPGPCTLADALEPRTATANITRTVTQLIRLTAVPPPPKK